MAAAAAGSVLGAQEAQGAVKQLVEALNKSIVTFDWARDPKTRKLVLQGVHVNVTTGMILGGVALALLWEAGNWIAQAINKNGSGAIPDLVDLMIPGLAIPGLAVTAAGTSLWIAKEVASLVPSNVSTTTPTTLEPHHPGSAPTKTVVAPATAGQAYNAMIRDVILAGPGTAAAQLATLVARLIPETT